MFDILLKVTRGIRDHVQLPCTEVSGIDLSAYVELGDGQMSILVPMGIIPSI